MLITLSRRTAICQSVSEVSLTGVAPLGAERHRFNFLKFNLMFMLIFKDKAYLLYRSLQLGILAFRSSHAPGKIFF